MFKDNRLPTLSVLNSNVQYTMYNIHVECHMFLYPGLKGPPGVFCVWIVRLFIFWSVLVQFRLYKVQFLMKSLVGDIRVSPTSLSFLPPS